MSNTATSTTSWSNWYQALSQLANKHDVSVADRDAWKEPWEQGQSPEAALYEEYPEFRSEPQSSQKQHATPCRECPWRRKSAPGWLGASEPGEMLALADSPAKMPCHLHVNYERRDWKAQASAAPQCAGRAVFQANRCKVPNSEQLVLPADREAVFTWPHEFVAHHARLLPATLMTTPIVDLYGVRRPPPSSRS